MSLKTNLSKKEALKFKGSSKKGFDKDSNKKGIIQGVDSVIQFGTTKWKRIM